jgi:hypothetical protein
MPGRDAPPGRLYKRRLLCPYRDMLFSKQRRARTVGPGRGFNYSPFARTSSA